MISPMPLGKFVNTLFKNWTLAVLVACAGCASENWHGEDGLVSLRLDKVMVGGFTSKSSG